MYLSTTSKRKVSWKTGYKFFSKFEYNFKLDLAFLWPNGLNQFLAFSFVVISVGNRHLSRETTHK